MKKGTTTILLILGLIVNSYGQIKAMFTTPEQIATHIPGFSEVTYINSKSVAYSASEEILMVNPTDSGGNKLKELRFAEELPVSITFKDGNVTKTSAGNVWTLRLQVANASNIRLIFKELILSPTSEMYVYNGKMNQLDSALVISKFVSNTSISTSVFNGNSVVVYILEKSGKALEGKLIIDTIEVGPYEMPASGLMPDIGVMSNACIPSVTCYLSCMPYARAVGRIVVSGSSGTGTLLNNEANNGEALFLTAFHVIDANNNGSLDPSDIAALSSALFRFQFWRNSCTGPINSSWVQFSGAQLRAASSSTDVVLLELLNPPGVGDGVNYAGWNRQSGAPTGSACFVLHHPEGDDMRYSSTSSVFTDPLFWKYWRVHYNTGATDPGSSGAALFNQNNQVVGQLKSGLNSCEFTDLPDIYGKFNDSWSDASLQTWLSPNLNLTSISLLNIHEMTISGPTVVPCDGSNKTYSVPNLVGCTYSWNVPGTLDIVSGQGTSSLVISRNNVITDIPTGIISVTITDSKGNSQVKTVNKEVTVAFPNSYYLTPQISGPPCISSGNLNLSIGADYQGYTRCNLYHDAGIDEIEWQVMSDFPYTIYDNSGVFNCSVSGLVEKAGLTGSFATQTSPYMVTIRLRAKNTCGTWGDWTPGFYQLISRCSFVYSFNAVFDWRTGEITFEKNNEKLKNALDADSYLIKIMDVYGVTVVEAEMGSKPKNVLNARNLKKGTYFIEISDGQRSEIAELNI